MTRILVIAAGVATLAACSPSPAVPYTSTTEVPEALQPAPDDDFDSSPRAAWIDGRDSFVVVVYGSSSCRPTPTGLSADDPRTVALELTPSANEICTSDLAPTAFQLETPDGAAAEGDVDLEIAWVGDDAPATFTTTIAD